MTIRLGQCILKEPRSKLEGHCVSASAQISLCSSMHG